MHVFVGGSRFIDVNILFIQPDKKNYHIVLTNLLSYLCKQVPVQTPTVRRSPRKRATTNRDREPTDNAVNQVRIYCVQLIPYPFIIFLTIVYVQSLTMCIYIIIQVHAQTQPPPLRRSPRKKVAAINQQQGNIECRRRERITQ